MRSVIRFFLSIKTAFGFFLVLSVICFYGSLSLPGNLAFFSGIDDTPLFRWLGEAKGFTTTWWIWLFIAVLAVLALNTMVCTVEALLFRLNRRALIVKLSPQVMHVGVLFIMLGHLLTASLGVKLDIDLAQGETKRVEGNASVTLENVSVTEDENGYVIDWEAKLRWLKDGKGTGIMSLRPSRPLYVGGYGLYSKSVLVDKEGSSALIRVSRDPGALWALLGGLMLCVGGGSFLYGRFRSSNSAFQS